MFSTRHRHLSRWRAFRVDAAIGKIRYIGKSEIGWRMILYDIISVSCNREYTV